MSSSDAKSPEQTTDGGAERRNVSVKRLPAEPLSDGHQTTENRGYTLAAQITCVRRELALRKNVYPKWVQSRRMAPEAADHEINCMQAVHDTLSALVQEKPKP